MLLAALASTDASAQAPAPAGRDGGQIVVTGRRPPEDLPGGQLARRAQLGVLGNRDVADAPFAVHSFTSELITNRQARSVADILDNDPATRVTWSPAAGYTYEEYAIRGSLVNSSDVTLNGLYGLSPTGAMPTEAIERLEVLKGPSAMLGGVALHGSLGGAVNIVPKRAIAAPLTTVSASYDSDRLFGAHFDIGRRFGTGRTLGVRANGVYRAGNTAIDRQRFALGFIAVGVDYDAGGVRLSLDGVYHDRRRTAPLWQLAVRPGFRIPDAPRPGRNFQQSWARLNAEDALLMARLEYDFAPGWAGFAAAGHKRSRIDALVALGSLYNARGDIMQTFGYIPRAFDTTTGEVGVRGAFKTGPLGHAVSLVAAGLRQDQAAFNSTARGPTSNIYAPLLVDLPAAVDRIGEVRRNSSAIRESVSIADTISAIGGRLQLLVGGRLQRIASPTFDRAGVRTAAYDETAFTPAVGLVIRPRPELSIYANRIEGLTQPFAPAGALNAAEIFAPARTEQHEAGAKLGLDRLTLSVSLYHIRQPRTIIDPVSLRYGVDGEQRTRGIDLNVTGEPLRGLRLLGGAALLDAKQTRTAGGVNRGKNAIGVSEVQLNLGAEVDLAAGEGPTLSALVLHTGHQYVDAANTQRLPAWTRIDVGARGALLIAGRPLTVRLNIENVLGRAYWASAARDLTLGAPRTVKLSVAADL
jgi:iron complex outermembrane receptor protein